MKRKDQTVFDVARVVLMLTNVFTGSWRCVGRLGGQLVGTVGVGSIDVQLVAEVVQNLVRWGVETTGKVGGNEKVW
jgi:hypothetical protein